MGDALHLCVGEPREDIRDYLNEILPGLADKLIQQVADLTPAAWVARQTSDNL